GIHHLGDEFRWDQVGHFHFSVWAIKDPTGWAGQAYLSRAGAELAERAGAPGNTACPPAGWASAHR
ncbi:hypothetical protein CYQ14_15345, partial [Enterococcus faecalis]|uniref:hypothetical protein n=1 Tax=Enterococcus faecalis TaxID=1351 RepID=UPI0010271525